jgi:hypothetical protein
MLEDTFDFKCDFLKMYVVLEPNCPILYLQGWMDVVIVPLPVFSDKIVVIQTDLTKGH